MTAGAADRVAPPRPAGDAVARSGAGFLRLGALALPWNGRGVLVGLGCVLACVVGVVLALSVGDLGVAPGEILGVLLGDGTRIQTWSVFSNRLPRALAALGVGALFGMSGAVFQSVTRNPLGSPDVIGLSAGAAAGAAVVSLMFTSIPVPVGALAGGLIAVTIVVAGSGSGLSAPHRMVVIGIGVAAMSVAVVQFVLARAQEQEALAIAGWIHGSLSARGWEHVRLVAIVVPVLGLLTLLLSRGLAVLEMGDETARGLGIAVTRTRLLAVVIGVVLAAIGVVVAGPIAFVALVAPQLGRRLTRASGPGIAVAGLVGAALLCVADVVAQHAFGSPVPVGIATAAVGGVYLVFLLMREWRRASA
ncbi:ferrichrome ABC transporter permease [Serinibacter arcticus]|uniref:Ferrichrome ABC transporter permease n=1 Tax=Serinibacter arcticus TaxID=1655435 RepID=A0A2U1ZXY1_9MICO|nr:iron chelate uptake ABC transporter family permease subunit [Serinibacter arcticus]PWD51848.1 ferrichrome ABC transporter permease [Serinibacter arcticus]